MASLLEAEAGEIPQLAARQFQRLAAQVLPVVGKLDALAPALFATIARGSSDHAAAFTAYLVAMRLRLPAASLPPSLASVYGTTLRLQRACVLAISQSGASPDLNLALEHAKAGGAWTLALINQAGSALSRTADLVLEIGAGAEMATAATKSFVLSATAGAHLVAAWARDSALLDALQAFPQTVEHSRPVASEAALELLASAQDAFVIGRGPTLPIAHELALKLKEVCGLHAEALSAAELLHGPVTIATPSRPAIVFAGDRSSLPSVEEAIARLNSAGAPVLVLSSEEGLCMAASRPAPAIEAGYEVTAPLVALCAVYPFLAELARARGRDPDRPPQLAKVTRTR